jgi:SAM-dependent methyltransferase
VTVRRGQDPKASPYDDAYYKEQAPGSLASAQAVMPLLLEATRARSVVDVGCGSGAWLAATQKLGVKEILGIDGGYVNSDALLIPSDRFRAVDLSGPLRVEDSFDLCISFEVAEHLSPERAESFVEDLTRLAPWVAFSAAIPGQGGLEHVNERWPDFWHRLFARHGYRPFDIVRRAVWDREDVEPWYAQNTFLFGQGDLDGQRSADDIQALPVRLVHPRVHDLLRHRLRVENENATLFRRMHNKVQLRGRLRLR